MSDDIISQYSITCTLIKQGRIQDLIRGGAQIVTGLKLPFWGLSFVEFWCLGLIFGGQGGGPGPRPPPLDPPLIKSLKQLPLHQRYRSSITCMYKLVKPHARNSLINYLVDSSLPQLHDRLSVTVASATAAISV